MKQCSKCGELKPFDSFYRMAGMRDGHRNDCKACNLAAKHERYVANPEPDKERARRWARDNPDRVQAQREASKLSGRKALNDRRSHLKRAHGITIDDYEAMLVDQGGVCAVCGKPPRSDISLHVDHDHSTGHRRGLLCFSCNNALGDVKDDVERLIAFVDYLTTHAEREPEIDQRLAALKVLAGR
jgi:hypothetical protein